MPIIYALFFPAKKKNSEGKHMEIKIRTAEKKIIKMKAIAITFHSTVTNIIKRKRICQKCITCEFRG